MVCELGGMHYKSLLVMTVTMILDQDERAYACLLINSSVLGAVFGIERAEYSVILTDFVDKRSSRGYY